MKTIELYLWMIETKTFGFVKWNQYFDKELFMFLLQGECKSIDYTKHEKDR